MAKASWNSSSARLSRDSFLPFSSCYLCLERAIDPVACAHGDLFCRECALSNILAQKKEIKRLQKTREQEDRDVQEEEARQDAAARERAIKEFELTQAGFDVKSGRPSATSASPNGEENRPPAPPGNGQLQRGEKRKFSLDEEEVARIAQEERTKARKSINDEKVRRGSPARLFHKGSVDESTLLMATISGIKTGSALVLGTFRNTKFE